MRSSTSSSVWCRQVRNRLRFVVIFVASCQNLRIVNLLFWFCSCQPTQRSDPSIFVNSNNQIQEFMSLNEVVCLSTVLRCSLRFPSASCSIWFYESFGIPGTKKKKHTKNHKSTATVFSVQKKDNIWKSAFKTIDQRKTTTSNASWTWKHKEHCIDVTENNWNVNAFVSHISLWTITLWHKFFINLVS